MESQPDAIPYVTSYYSKNWGFCLSKNTIDSMPEGNYKIRIDSEFKKGKLDLIEAKIDGIEKEKEIFFSSYLCHPSMVNNELSGPVLINELITYIKSKHKKNNYTYRFVILPETIGSIAYLSKKKDELKTNLICGFNLTCVGDDQNFSHIQSRKGNNIADKALNAALLNKENHKKYSFLERGSDERQYCSPGIDLPICTFCRSKFGTFPEYHTSLDNFNLVNEKGLQGSFDVIKTIIDSFECSLSPKNINYCEPQLGKRGLYPNISNFREGIHPSRKLMNILAYCDGVNSLFDISEILDLNLRELIDTIFILKKNKLVK